MTGPQYTRRGFAKEAREQMERLGFDPAPSTPAEMAALHRDEYELFRKLVQVDGVRFD